MCLLLLVALALLNGTMLCVVLLQATDSASALAQVSRVFTWPVLAKCSALSLVPLWGVAYGVSRWIAREVEEPIARVAEQCRRVRQGFAACKPVPPPRIARTPELAGLRDAVNDMLSHVDGLLQQQHRGIADAAHELRTPLTAQALVAENALAKRGSSAELRDAVASMLEESRYMQRLIEKLLVLKRASATRSPTSDELSALPRQDLSELARGCVQALQVLAEEKGQTIALKLGGPLWARVDPTMARQAMLNVVHNAIEHCPRGTRIEVETASQADGLGLVAVSDNGPGIRPEDELRVFESFFRGSGTSRHRGLGLGLAIARATLASQGGCIHLSSQPGRGCRFELLLPLAVPAKRPAGRLPGAGESVIPDQWQEPSIA